MKTKTWLLLIGAVLAASLGLSLVCMLPREDAAYVQVLSDGKVIHTLDLRVDRQITVTTEKGTNVITVKDGKVAVTEADCPDHICMDRGFCSSGLQIVCLPNGLVIRFVGEQNPDSVVG